MIDLNQRAKQVHESNHRWWHDLETGERLQRNKGELLMLVVSEVAECMEYERKGGCDSHLQWRLGAEVEMADAYIRLLDYAGAFNLDLTFNVNWDEVYNLLIIPDNKGQALFDIVGCIISAVDDNEEAGIVVSIYAIMAYCRKHRYDLEGAFRDKFAYNQTRKDHSKEARLAEGGKKW